MVMGREFVESLEFKESTQFGESVGSTWSVSFASLFSRQTFSPFGKGYWGLTRGGFRPPGLFARCRHRADSDS